MKSYQLDSLVNIKNTYFELISKVDIREIQVEFDSILNNECHGALLDTEKSLICLNRLSQVQNVLEQQRKSANENGITYNKCDECLYIKTSKNVKNVQEKFLFYHHVFWQLDESSNLDECKKRVMFLNIKSFLKTQNVCCTKLLFWKLKVFPEKLENELRTYFSDSISNGWIEIRNFDLDEICSREFSSFKSAFSCRFGNYYFKIINFLKFFVWDKSFFQNIYVSLSDMVRFMVLDIFGGIYTDGDVIYLKDMRLLWKHNFAYRWSYLDEYNTAIIGLNRHLNPSINELYTKFKEKTSIMKQFHPLEIKKFLNLTNIYDSKVLRALHSVIFDPIWLCNDGIIDYRTKKADFPCGFTEFFKETQLNLANIEEKFFPGAFTYHVHLKSCQKEVPSNSYFNLLEKHFNLKQIYV